jgi:hypothetical protein
MQCRHNIYIYDICVFKTWHQHLWYVYFRHDIGIDDMSVFKSTLMSFPKNMSSHVSNKVFQCYSLVLYHIVKNVAVLLWNESVFHMTSTFITSVYFTWHLYLWHQCFSDIYIYDISVSDMTSTLMTSVYFTYQMKTHWCHKCICHV